MRSPLRWWLLCAVWCCALLPLLAIDIIDLPGEGLDAEYDITWTVTAERAPAGALLLGVEMTADGRGYLLRLEKGTAVWLLPGGKTPVVLGQGAAKLDAGTRTTFTLKRRAGTIALLQQHRLVCAIAAPRREDAAGTVVFRAVPAGLTVTAARYQTVERLNFGDDFMRPEAGSKTRVPGWHEDTTWKVAYFLKDDPGKEPRNPKTGVDYSNPWALSFWSYSTTTAANGFWYVYRGVGPSWVVADPTMAYPTWDRYFVEAAVKPEFDSTVGLIAAYQDNKNYLLFRWKPRAAGVTTPRAELLAYIDGTPRVLATSMTGFAPTQWYTVRLNLGWGVVQALVDGQVIMDARNPGAVEGRVGMYADGAANPRRPQVDDITANMYVTTDEKTGHVVNDAADAMRTTSIVYFDDVRVGSWIALENLFASSYPVEKAGTWTTDGQVQRAKSGGRLVSGLPDWSLYTANTRVQVGANGSAGILFHVDGNGNGYAWTLTAQGQRVQQLVKYAPKTEVARSAVGVKPGAWATLRVEADGPYAALYCNGERVMDVYDPAHAAGRCGVTTERGNAAFGAFSISLGERRHRRLEVHKSFVTNAWIATWASPAADWYPAFTPAAYITPAGEPHTKVGFAAPLPTDKPGLYWNKGGYYHDLRVIVPVAATAVDGQTVHLSDNYNAAAMYRLQLAKGNDAASGQAILSRVDAKVGSYPFRITPKSQLVFERRGAYLLLTAQELDPDPSIPLEEPVVLSEQVVFAYRDPQPLPATQVGFTVTSPTLSAQRVIIESDRIQDAFERAPAGWITGGGIWSVTNRYSCQPQWNWFGGFGTHTPLVWSKARLDGDQTVEVYMGIKMQFDNAPEEYARRYRDMNVSICADGVHLNSGYTLVRAGRPNNRVVTLLFRNNVVVAQSSLQEHLLPPQGQGHRQWPAMRIEKRGGELKVFLDNKLAFTYKDPDPLPGGYVGFWTLNNGIMLGRANLSAESMTLGSPRAAEPLAVQEEFPAQAVPALALGGTTLAISTLEKDMDGWKERAGIGGRLLRVRETDSARGVNTYLKVVNAYPAGDLAVNAPAGINVERQPLLHVDYQFDPGVKVNCYAKVQGIWVEFLLTGAEAQEPNVVAGGRAPAVADGIWHHLEINLGEKIEAALKLAGKAVMDMTLQELVFADWHPTGEARCYGFGENPGGSVIRFDNLVYLPETKAGLTVSWSGPDAVTTAWRTALDNAPWSVPGAETTDRTLAVQPAATPRTLHVQAKTADGKWGPVVHLPIPAKK